MKKGLTTALFVRHMNLNEMERKRNGNGKRNKKESDKKGQTEKRKKKERKSVRWKEEKKTIAVIGNVDHSRQFPSFIRLDSSDPSFNKCNVRRRRERERERERERGGVALSGERYMAPT